MKSVLDFSGRERLEKTIKDSWNLFRDDLTRGIFKFDEIEKAKNSIFLKSYDDLFHHHSGLELKTITLENLMGIGLARGTVLKEGEEANYDRFLPKEEFVTEDNRFSPPGVEWLYLACGPGDNMYACAIAECRAKTGDRFGFCQFEINECFKDCKIVDLTIADDISYDEINNAYVKDLKKFEMEKRKAIKTGKFSKELLNKTGFNKDSVKWGVYTYAKLLAEQIFVPLESCEDKSIAYAPFQTIAQYYISNGYSGILFSSTVYPEGTNLVLFDKQMAIPKGDIRDNILS